MSIFKKKVLLKLSGTIFVDKETNKPSVALLHSLIDQIITLQNSYQFALVIGGGNIFRGNQQGKELQLDNNTAHQIGMLATISNGLIIRDVCVKKNLETVLFSAIDVPSVARAINTENLQTALMSSQLIIFTGGTGNPFFTTDTTAVVRALQIGAYQVWKGTNVDGVYSADPARNKQAKPIKKLLYADALAQKLCIMDSAAYALANDHGLPTRIFDIFTPNALTRAAQEDNFGSILLSEDMHNEYHY